MVDVAQRSTQVAGDQIENLRCRGGKPANFEVALQHQNGNVDAAEQVLKIVANAGRFGVASYNSSLMVLSSSLVA
jgi:TRAP-type C4-dicarboxylate transport system substrate-binding protein